MQDGGDVGYLAPEYRAMLDQQPVSSGADPIPHSSAAADQNGGGGGGAGGRGGGRSGAGAGAGGARELAAAEEAVRQRFRDPLRLGGAASGAGGGGGGGGGGAAGGGGKGRMAGLDTLLSRAGDAGAGLAEVVAYMRG